MTAPSPSKEGSGYSPSATHVILHVVERVYNLLRLVLWVFLILGVAHYVARSVEALAGEETYATFLVSYFASGGSGLTVTVSFSGTGAAVIWALTERWLRQRAIRRLTARTTELEQKLDPNRSSSGLTPEGKTHPRDR